VVLSSSLTVTGIVTDEPSSTVAEASVAVGARSSCDNKIIGKIKKRQG